MEEGVKMPNDKAAKSKKKTIRTACTIVEDVPSCLPLQKLTMLKDDEVIVD
jgi:hypothetical protein